MLDSLGSEGVKKFSFEIRLIPYGEDIKDLYKQEIKFVCLQQISIGKKNIEFDKNRCVWTKFLDKTFFLVFIFYRLQGGRFSIFFYLYLNSDSPYVTNHSILVKLFKKQTLC